MSAKGLRCLHYAQKVVRLTGDKSANWATLLLCWRGNGPNFGHICVPNGRRASSRVDGFLRDLNGVFFIRTIEHYDTSTSQLNIGACNLDDNGLRLCLPEAPSWHANYFGCL
jgi:hypothetical protein